MAANDPTDMKVRAALYRITRVYLEIERGLRPPEHLKGLIGDWEYTRQRARPMDTRHPNAGPVLPDDIGHIHIDRNTPDRITASVPTREVEDRWGALVVSFHTSSNGWVIDRLERLNRRGLTAEQQPTEVEPEDFDRRLQLVGQERRMVKAALNAVQTRIDDLDPGTPGRPLSDIASERDLDHQRDRWQQRLDELDRELEQITKRRTLQQELGAKEGPERDGDRAADVDPVSERLSRVIGPAPSDPERKDLWEAAYREVTTYRKVWDITDEETLLGPKPDYDGERRHRDRVVEALRAARTELRPEPERAAHDRVPRRERDRSIGIEL